LGARRLKVNSKRASLEEKTIVLVCHHIWCGVNRAQFQRANLLCREYKTHIFAAGDVCEEVAKRAQSVHYCPGQGVGMDKIIFPIWASFAIWRLSLRRRLYMIYTTASYAPALLVGYLLKALNMHWVADMWDEPRFQLEKRIQEAPSLVRRTLMWVYHQLWYHLARKVLKRADLVIVAMAPEILKHYGLVPEAHNIIVTTNGVDLSLTTLNEAPEGKYTIVYVGNLRKFRGVELIIDASRVLKKRGISFTCRLIGPTDEKGKDWIRRLISSYHLQDQVVFHGELPHPEALRWVSRAHVAICVLSPTIRNYRFAYPVKLFEYMALGKAIVCTRLPGTSRIIQDGENGLLIPPEDSEALAAALMRLYENKTLRKKLGENARYSASRYNWEEINARLRKAIEKLLEKT